MMLPDLANAAARSLRRRRFSQARYEQAVDRLVAAYVDWREESIAVREAYSVCGTAREHRAHHAFAVYVAALDREERAAVEYAESVERVGALVSARGKPLVMARVRAGSAPGPPRRSNQ